MNKALYTPIKIVANTADQWDVTINSGAAWTTFTATPGTYPTLIDLLKHMADLMDVSFATQAIRPWLGYNEDGKDSEGRISFNCASGWPNCQLMFPANGGGTAHGTRSIGPTLGYEDFDPDWYAINSDTDNPTCKGELSPIHTHVFEYLSADDGSNHNVSPSGNLPINVISSTGQYRYGISCTRKFSIHGIPEYIFSSLVDGDTGIIENIVPGDDDWTWSLDERFIEQQDYDDDYDEALYKFLISGRLSGKRTWKAPNPKYLNLDISAVSV